MRYCYAPRMFVAVFSKEKQFPEVIEFTTSVINSWIALKDSLEKVEDP
jgi:hypothetical protein